jgi:hypothetical protein
VEQTACRSRFYVKALQTWHSFEKIIFLEKSDKAEYLVAYDKRPDISNRINVNTVVPDRHFFLLGDNRNQARNSLFKGPVPIDNVIEKKL